MFRQVWARIEVTKSLGEMSVLAVSHWKHGEKNISPRCHLLQFYCALILQVNIRKIWRNDNFLPVTAVNFLSEFVTEIQFTPEGAGNLSVMLLAWKCRNKGLITGLKYPPTRELVWGAFLISSSYLG